MKCQVLFSLKNSDNIFMNAAAIATGVLRVYRSQLLIYLEH